MHQDKSEKIIPKATRFLNRPNLFPYSGNCGNCKCNKRCSACLKGKEECPPCEKVCGKKLLCKTHHCQQLCHQAGCPPCGNKIKIPCACTKTFIEGFFFQNCSFFFLNSNIIPPKKKFLVEVRTLFLLLNALYHVPFKPVIIRLLMNGIFFPQTFFPEAFFLSTLILFFFF